MELSKYINKWIIDSTGDTCYVTEYSKERGILLVMSSSGDFEWKGGPYKLLPEFVVKFATYRETHKALSNTRRELYPEGPIDSKGDVINHFFYNRYTDAYIGKSKNGESIILYKQGKWPYNNPQIVVWWFKKGIRTITRGRIMF